MGLKKHTTRKCGPARRSKKRPPPDPESSIRKVNSAFMFIGIHKGISNEDRFEAIFNGAFYKPSWFVGIRRATRHEDQNEATDFFVQTRGFSEIRFDIKSSWAGYQEQIRSDRSNNVWCIVITPEMSDAEIIGAVFSKCERHIRMITSRCRTRTA